MDLISWRRRAADAQAVERAAIQTSAYTVSAKWNKPVAVHYSMTVEAALSDRHYAICVRISFVEILHETVASSMGLIAKFLVDREHRRVLGVVGGAHSGRTILPGTLNREQFQRQSDLAPAISALDAGEHVVHRVRLGNVAHRCHPDPLVAIGGNDLPVWMIPGCAKEQRAKLLKRLPRSDAARIIQAGAPVEVIEPVLYRWRVVHIGERREANPFVARLAGK